MAAKLFEEFPCILVTGRGCPDIATRALVSTLHRELGLPVDGMCAYNPYGIQVMSTFSFSNLIGLDGGHRYSVPMQ